MYRFFISILSLCFFLISTTVAAGTKDDVVHAAEVASATAPNLKDRIATGESLFVANCSACHQTSGKGLPGAFPPLAGSDYFVDDPDESS